MLQARACGWPSSLPVCGMPTSAIVSQGPMPRWCIQPCNSPRAVWTRLPWYALPCPAQACLGLPHPSLSCPCTALTPPACPALLCPALDFLCSLPCPVRNSFKGCVDYSALVCSALPCPTHAPSCPAPPCSWPARACPACPHPPCPALS